MEDRMLSDEILLGIINSKSGGGGGTGNYNDLTNQPKIGGRTLIGNQSASDLGLQREILYGATDPTGGEDGNLYFKTTSASNADVFGTPSANTGDGYEITTDVSAFSDYAPYEGFGNGIGFGKNGAGRATLIYHITSGKKYKPKSVSLCNNFDVVGGYLTSNSTVISGSLDGTNWTQLATITTLTDKDESTTEQISTNVFYSYFKFEILANTGYPGIKNIVLVGESDSEEDNKIDNIFFKQDGKWLKDSFAQKSEVDDIKDGTGINSFADVESALSDVTDDVDSLKSGLINYQTQNNLNLEVPDRKNILPITVSGIKSANRSGTWNGNTYTLSTITMTIDTDSNGNVESVTLNGTGNNNIYLAVSDKFTANTNADVVLSGANIGANSLYMSDESIPTDITTAEFTTTSGHEYVAVYHATESSYNSFKLYPMIRLATITDPTFAPYIPSVESRIEAVESGLTNLTLKDVKYTRYAFNEANTSVNITIPTWKSYVGIAHHPFAGNAGTIVIINSGSSGNLGAYQTSNVFTITKSGNVFTFTNGSTPMYLDLYEIVP